VAGTAGDAGAAGTAGVAGAAGGTGVPELGPGASGAETVRRMWPDVMARLSGVKRTTWSLVSHYAQVLDFDGKRLLLQFDSPGRAASFGRGAHQEFLRQALIDVLGIDCTFEAVAGDSRAKTPTEAPQAGITVPDPWAPAAPAQESGAGASEDSPAPARREPVPKAPAPVEAARAPSARRSVVQLPPADDIPLPPEPPPDDIPPEDAFAGRPRQAGQASSKRAARPEAAPARQPTAPAPASTRLADDVPSVDDVDLEGSNLVGASVVEQLLGGRVIEERQD
jgi:DNA polymerase-3 subunit gamma/tau